ncbi:MAG TPA: S-methyl-5'-thioinosine phosphorylase [Burkholderiales bacterium]|jgi:5'-methylthioadenosine phosphorylase
MLAIIGGSGLSKLANMEISRRKVMRTPYGEPSGALTLGRIAGCDVIFLARHGYGHTIAPHQVNYRANLWALKEAGAKEIVSVASVGSIRKDLWPGVLVLPHQIIDYTWGRPSTFFEGAGVAVHHIDFTEPYSAALRGKLAAAAAACGERLADGGVYAATQGPRLETAAEITRLERDGADIVGMTGMPEAALAREVGVEYATIAVVANFAAGRGESEHAIPMDRIGAVLEESMGRVRRIIEKLCET